jgi:hypothetical protein
MRGFLARLIATAMFLALAGPAVAGHNYSDFWGATNGATLNIAQQGSSVVVTGFLYDTDRLPTWITFGGTLDANESFSGDVLQNAGDVPSNNFVSNWNPFVVGTAAIQFTSMSRASFTLTLNGTTTTGTLRRANIGRLPLAGEYAATIMELLENCTNRQNRLVSSLGLFTVQLNDAGNAMTGSFSATDRLDSCTYYVPLVQMGSVATGNGSFTCNDGTDGDAAIESLRAFDDVLVIQMTRTFRRGDTCIATTLLSGGR